MSEAVFEFPLKEKVRNYLRVEQLLGQLKSTAKSDSVPLQMVFFEQLFELLDLIERLDLRSDMSKDLDAHEKNLVYWSQHPKIDSAALDQALKTIVNLKQKLKTDRRFGSALKEDKLLSAIRQRFAIPGGSCSFDLPNLHFWLQQPAEVRQQEIGQWLETLSLLDDTIAVSLSFIRERGQFKTVTADNGFYQGAAEDKNELIRIKCRVDEGYYPTLSGNKYRYALRFLWFSPAEGQNAAVESNIQFKLAAC
ncbi:cell division protein ZapD [Alteromonas sp. KS69]|jgi:cell division protein ZapD|uniref:cell division protein ZapD n=1 Tax=Alteromonas TaxID=226 RepID=UPI000C0E78F9|nr:MULTISPECIES: cell division protein ZapD [Alteromonas]MCQ8848271.1 cell division protein ZapD [Alteromonas stellipolaris]PHS54451.1 MAG: cell division protein ZapD [Alteromonas sp.]RUP75802.1 cell division protein ZapD [Alteromonas sp. KS69]VEL98142.1 cell division protein ZapD [Alteromonas sp. 76-1]|tara:strand:- start:853 stop:1605 length:753 start_codon:yes stop_codon:yes gene_type:complete